MNRTRRLIPTALAATLLAATLPAFAQDNFPNRPIRIVVPFTAGGVVDSVARLIGEKLSTKYGQPVIVENRVGAGGSIGTDFVAKAPADGYTLLCVSPSHAVAPILNKGVTWNPTRDFRGIEGFGIVPNIVVVHPDLPVKDMADLIAMAKRSAQPLTFATAGVGTSNHLAGELLAQVADIKLTPVPYKGQPEALNDMLAGRVTLMPLTSALALGHMRSGKLKGLAVTTAKRSVASPQLPTVAETPGMTGYEVGTWFGMVAPAKTPDPVVRKLSADMREIIGMPDVKAKLEGLGMEFTPQGPAEFDAFVAGEFTKWTRVMKRAGVEPQ